MSALQARQINIGNIKIGGGNPLVLIAGPCVIEGEQETYRLAEKLQGIARGAGVPLVFKASYDKANRTSLNAYRGPGLNKGLEILSAIKKDFSLPVLSDVHRFEEIGPAAEVLDILQVPAFLCRQTDFIVQVARAGKAVNIKKGQFLAPQDMGHVAEKVASTGNRNLLLTERGSSFGYNNLVVDMRSLILMKEFCYPVVFDATHSVQLPGAKGNASGGDRQFIAPLARAAVAVGIDALFMEVHESPDDALCDGPNSIKLSELPLLLHQLAYIAKNSDV
ncbi:MAG: 3-deoxy-8-phosphooctulonate synthase [Pseudomonadota bacterium]